VAGLRVRSFKIWRELLDEIELFLAPMHGGKSAFFRAAIARALLDAREKKREPRRCQEEWGGGLVVASVKLPHNVDEELVRLASELGTSVNDLIRRAVCEEVERRRSAPEAGDTPKQKDIVIRV